MNKPSQNHQEDRILAVLQRELARQGIHLDNDDDELIRMLGRIAHEMTIKERHMWPFENDKIDIILNRSHRSSEAVLTTAKRLFNRGKKLGIVESFQHQGSSTWTKGLRFDDSVELIGKAEPTIGIITALPKEYVAVKVLLEHPKEFALLGRGAGRRYCYGIIPTVDGGEHSVVLSLAGMGTNLAARQTALLLDHFPSVDYIIMIGIAGGVPNPDDPAEHIRLGDVVVSDEVGVIQYDFGKEKAEEFDYRPRPRPPSPILFEAVRLLEGYALEGQQPWLKYIPDALDQLEIVRPPIEMDILFDTTDPNLEISHPFDPKRKLGEPKIHIGPIASGNRVLANSYTRDLLRDKFKIKAVEMEASGIADSTWSHQAGYLVVRGICDYCDSNKNDVWQEYAAVMAASYTRALLSSIPESLLHRTSNKQKLPPIQFKTRRIQAVFCAYDRVTTFPGNYVDIIENASQPPWDDVLVFLAHMINNSGPVFGELLLPHPPSFDKAILAARLLAEGVPIDESDQSIRSAISAALQQLQRVISIILGNNKPIR